MNLGIILSFLPALIEHCKGE